jgi:hypothetical protein
MVHRRPFDGCTTPLPPRAEYGKRKTANRRAEPRKRPGFRNRRAQSAELPNLHAARRLM